MEALPSTNNIKSIVTLEDKMDIERKGSQSVQGTLYVCLACFGNAACRPSTTSRTGSTAANLEEAYRVYARWCKDNLEKLLAAKTFLHYVREHQKEIGIIYDDKCIGNSQGFRNISLTPFAFVQVDEDDPDLP